MMKNMSEGWKTFTVVVGGTFLVLSFMLLFGKEINEWRQYDNGMISKQENEGMQAGLQGIPVEACPYTADFLGSGGHLIREWKKGWVKGYMIYKERDQSK